MKRRREDLEKILEQIFIKVALEKEYSNKSYEYLKERFNIPIDISTNLIYMRMSVSEVNEFILYCLLDSFAHLQFTNENIEDYFTEQEIRNFSNTKYEIDQIEFPIIIKCVQVFDDQWIGKVDSEFLMKLRQKQLVNYNVNTQRTMTKITRGNKELYKITLSMKNIKAIQKSLENNTYIPDALTLNIPLDSDAIFEYDEKTNELIIHRIDSFDIIDGYHRFIAMCKASDKNPNFNYATELRITNFSVDKANNFIYQQDQKTRMTKLDSDSLNMNNAANVIVLRLNENPTSYLKGMIDRNEGQINFGELAHIINYFYFKKNNDNLDKKHEILITKELINRFNCLIENRPELLDRKLSFMELCICIEMFYYNKDEDINSTAETILSMIDNQEKMNSKIFVNKKMRKKVEQEILNLERLVVRDV